MSMEDNNKIPLAELLNSIATQSFMSNAESNSSCFGWAKKPKKQEDCSIGEQLISYCSELKGASETGVRCILQITEGGLIKITLPKEEEKKEILKIMSKYPEVFKYAFDFCSNEKLLEFYEFYTTNEAEIKKAGKEFLEKKDLIKSCEGNSIDEVIQKMENKILQSFFNSIYSSDIKAKEVTFAASNPMVKTLISSLLSDSENAASVFESQVDAFYSKFLLAVWHAAIPAKFLTNFLIKYNINEG
jgi:hypothetical protein